MAIGIPIGLVGYAAQEMLLRRRAVKRTPGAAPETVDTAPGATLEGADVTVRDADSSPAGAGTVAKKASAGQAKPVPPGATAIPTRPRKATTATPRKPAAGARALTPGTAPARKATVPTAGTAPAPKPTRSNRAPSLDALKRRRASLERGLDAVVAFVDGPARRGPATACADALLLAIPKNERGPDLEAFLHAAGAREAPARLQELAEDAGVELATSVKAVNAALKARTAAK